jgi:glycosyltransferase involved in cell wall biosynthesis
LYPPEIGGPATYASLLATRLAEYDSSWSVEVIPFVRVRHLPKLVRHIAYARLVLRAVRRADILLALDPVSTGLPAMVAAKLARKPFFVKIVGDYAWEQGRQRFGITESLDAFVLRRDVPLTVRLLRRIQSRVARSAVRVIVPSQYLKRIVSAWGIDPEKIEVVYNSVEVPAAGRITNGVSSLPRPRIVSVGRLVPWKRVDGVICAVAELQMPASLVIVGEGPDRVQLENLAQERVGDGVHFTGALAHDDTLAVIRDADIFVLNSTYEGLSHLLIEALAVGAAIIATDAGGNGEVVTHEKTGLLIPVEDPSALPAALERLLADPELRERLGAAAKAEAGRFSVDAMLSGTLRVLAAAT